MYDGNYRICQPDFCNKLIKTMLFFQIYLYIIQHNMLDLEPHYENHSSCIYITSGLGLRVAIHFKAKPMIHSDILSYAYYIAIPS